MDSQQAYAVISLLVSGDVLMMLGLAFGVAVALAILFFHH